MKIWSAAVLSRKVDRAIPCAMRKSNASKTSPSLKGGAVRVGLPIAHGMARSTFCVALALAAVSASAADGPQPPDRREILVPTRDLETVLAGHPRAVLLSREQYETLLRDAKKTLTPAPEPPQRAVLASARYTATPTGDVIDGQAEFTVNVLSDEWAEVPLRLPVDDIPGWS
ncbi:MAG: hypothetical protein WCH43_01820, partial [Verrucomicrobiota bacterium]